MKKLDASINEIVAELKKQEKAQDELLRVTRELVRGCSVAIKHIHAKEIREAEERVREVEKLVKEARKLDKELENISAQAYQEYVEVKLLLAAIEKKELPTYKELGVPFEVYLTGMCDLVGELRREMQEELKRGKKKQAEYYFDKMDEIFEATLPLKFSNSLLPNFRKKQDVARGQVERARSELLGAR